jgi:hypothetical protein
MEWGFWTLESTKWNAATRYCTMTASNTLYRELWKMQCKQMLQFTVLNMVVSGLLLASANESHRSGTVARAVASDVLRVAKGSIGTRRAKSTLSAAPLPAINDFTAS